MIRLFSLGLAVPPGLAGLSYLFYCILPTCYFKCLRKPCLLKNRADKQVMLTFDDGPEPRYTERLLEVLAKNHVHAVFFVVAKKAAEHPRTIRRILEGGHQVGLHALEHKSAWCKGWRCTKRDFEKSLSILDGLGCKVHYYRPPWGHFNLASLLYAKKHRLKIMLWTVMAQDWEQGSTSQRVLRRLLSRTKNGSVICLHDSGEGSGEKDGAPLATIDALSKFLPAMSMDGYEFLLPDHAL